MLAALAMFAALSTADGAAAQEARSLAGRLLVAKPEMGDSRFTETVIFMVRHDRRGAMGLVINKPVVRTPLSSLFERMQQPAPEGEIEGDILVHYGGPVAPEQGFMLHSTDVLVEGSQVVDDDTAMTARIDMLSRIATGEGPARSLFALGYAGWGPGQLEGELEQGVWFVIPAEDSLVFAEDPERTWDRAMAKRGIEL